MSPPKEITDWHRRCSTMPDFDEFRDVEYIRQSARVNMFDTTMLMRIMYDMGLYAGVTWLDRCQSMGYAWILHYDEFKARFVKEHGPVESWFNVAFDVACRKQEIENKKRDLQRQLRELEQEAVDVHR